MAVEDVGNGFNVVINGEVVNFAPYTPGDESSRAAALSYAEQSFNMLSGQASWQEQPRAPEADWWLTGGQPAEPTPAPTLAPSYQATATPAGWREYPEQQPDGSIEIWATDDAGNFRYVRTVQGLTAGGAAPTTGAGVPTGYPTGGTYNTRDGPLPEAELRSRLQQSGYNGPWDAASMVAAYNRAPLGAGGGAGAGSYDIYSPVNNLVFKYAELAYWRERLERFDIPGLEQDKIRDAMNAALQYTSQMGYMLDPKLFGEYMQGKGAFPAGTVPTLERERFQWSQQQELAKLMANPATLVQGLTALGNRPEQVSSFLQQSPLYQSLIPDYMRQYYQPRTGYGSMMPAGQGGYEGGLLGTPAPSTTQQPFQFPQGYQLPVRQTLWDIQNQSSRIPLISSMMSFAGMNPENEWAKFYGALPKGGREPLSRYF